MKIVCLQKPRADPQHAAVARKIKKKETKKAQWGLFMLNKSVIKVVTFLKDRDEQGHLLFWQLCSTALHKVSVSMRRPWFLLVKWEREGQEAFCFGFFFAVFCHSEMRHFPMRSCDREWGDHPRVANVETWQVLSRRASLKEKFRTVLKVNWLRRIMKAFHLIAHCCAKMCSDVIT